MASRSSESGAFEQRDDENQWQRDENVRLRRLLAAHGIAIPQPPTDDMLPAQASEPVPKETKEERARKRIALFRSLFRGREDVMPSRA
jgi:hypothetical protein